MFGFSKKSLVGIDIGTASIKVVELSRSSGHFKLETYGIAQLPHDAKIPETQSPLRVTINALRELLKKSGIKGRRIVASLPTSTVFLTVIDIPQIEPKYQRQAIEREAQKIVPMPLSDVTISWGVIPPSVNGPDATRTEVTLTAVPNYVIANYIKVFQELRLEPEAIEVEATALIRSLIGQDTSTVLIIDVGSRTSTVNLIDHGFIFFSKNINVGGESVTNSIAQNLNVNLERAEQFKRTLGLPGSPDAGSAPRAIQPSLDILKIELEQVMHLSQGRGRVVEKIILTGGGAKLIGLDKFLASSFNIPVTIGNPWARVLVPDKIKSLLNELGPALAVTIGLAMRPD